MKLSTVCSCSGRLWALGRKEIVLREGEYRDLMEALEWSGTILFQSIVSTVHIFRANIAVQKFRT